ncbi:class I SAM-dependent methyltransferase [Corynebacterium breve]|uniref:Class I SAM-dependent methyltransferase n=2 Tax=Corynebacterium breve TaxID=3049799 RepID=A0ABY8VIY0_9CORY|nr:class I SAM-dependent methyltransferase [Corynebacterium breve]WIM69022.1 class I SAM-dependent methyltransferase [Corynebacterium breve]
MSMRARVSEARFAKACTEAGLELRPDHEPDLVVDTPDLFPRLSDGGWVGLAESYLAGEWHTESPHDLVKVLRALLQVDFVPRTLRVKQDREHVGGEVPPELVERFSGDGLSAFSGIFATGVPTTRRVSVQSHVKGAGHGREPASHFVDVTHLSAPLEVDRIDLGDAQRRAAESLLDLVDVSAGTHVVEYPSSGGAVSIAAAQRQATVDTVTADRDLAEALRERFTFAGVDDAVHIELIDAPEFGPGRWHGRYDAVVSVEKLETLPQKQRAGYLAAIDRLLAPGGQAAMQTVIKTPAMNKAGIAALESLRAYVWPALDYPTEVEVARIVDKRTGLRVIGQVHAPDHLERSLRLQREIFVSQLREAAADGFDSVYRRLWIWQLSLREALSSLGMIDVVQFSLVHRNRRGLR